MAVELKRAYKFSGSKASIYVAVNTNSNSNPLSDFLKTYSDTDYEDKAMNLVGRIKSMGTKTGVLDEFLKLQENEKKGQGDNVCALFDIPEKEMRLYCIKISESIIIIGGGAPKPDDIQSWQQCPNLSKAARYMIFISEKIKQKLNNGGLKISNNGMRFEGDLVID